MPTAKEQLSRINYQWTISTRRLFYRFGTPSIMDFATVIIAIALLIFAILLLLTTSHKGDSIQFKIVLITISIWLPVNMLMNKVMVKFVGNKAKQEDNLKDLSKVIERYFTGITLEQVQDNIWQDLNPCGFWHSGWVITIIFEGNTIYLNKYTLGRNDSVIPWSGIRNYLICKKIAKYFELDQIDYSPVI